MEGALASPALWGASITCPWAPLGSGQSGPFAPGLLQTVGVREG